MVMKQQEIPAIFLSYARKDDAFANSIDSDFMAIGIRLNRDIRDIPYKSDLDDFMNRVKQTDYTLLLVSDAFLKSRYCMYEVMQLLDLPDFIQRILPVVIEDVNFPGGGSNYAGIFRDKNVWNHYLSFWQLKYEALEQLLTASPHANYDSAQDELRLHRALIDTTDKLFAVLGKLNCRTLKELQSENYHSLLEHIGFENRSLLEESLRIRQMPDGENKDLELDAFLEKYPDNGFGLFLRAEIAADKKEFRKAKKYYEDLFEKIPDSPAGRVNYGILLEENFNDAEGAAVNYIRAANHDSNFFAAFFNAARVLARLNRKDEAFQYLKQLVEIRSTSIEQLATQGVVYIDHLQRPDKAEVIFNEVLLAMPKHAGANYGMGKIYHFYKKDPVAAAEYYQQAIESEPGHIEAIQCYAILIESVNPEQAKKLYETALQFQPENAEVHFNFAILLKNYFKTELEMAQHHYETAVSGDPRFIRKPLDELFGITRPGNHLAS